MRLATDDPEAAADLIADRWHERMPLAMTATAWAQLGKQAALKQLPRGGGLFPAGLEAVGRRQQAQRPRRPGATILLAWQVRAALRQPDNDRLRWPLALRAIAAMSAARQREGDLGLLEGPRHVGPGQARRRGRSRAGRRARGAGFDRRPACSFYGKLATEDLGSSPRLPAGARRRSAAAERDAPRSQPGLVRALQLIGLGLRNEGVREWNFTLRGMADRELLAAAQLACEREVWDRCINTSDRTRGEVDIAQRFPLPFRDQVVPQARQAGLDPAYVYGLIRQESRFVIDARSQRRRLGPDAGDAGHRALDGAQDRHRRSRPEMIADRDINLQLGTATSSWCSTISTARCRWPPPPTTPGPAAPRRWRDGGAAVEPAVWAENIPVQRDARLRQEGAVPTPPSTPRCWAGQRRR